ncbi:ferrous iron transport protein A [Nakamurella sp. YIM 132087]|uniref:Ferrous iron transport protein A n=1 Tax=Nakamurella alba TaxID=2665158 RepID=A0A7K1FI63_9ACTN|nr:ferrous iron transport protein A [Nakamurella alba]MTD12574.1 ferrous iron transport protein A [Nakamurella alba]
MTHPLLTLPLGTRVVIRHRLEGGSATDALGELLERDDNGCTVGTKYGPVRIAWTAVVAGKEIPPPPDVRRRRGR